MAVEGVGPARLVLGALREMAVFERLQNEPEYERLLDSLAFPLRVR